MARIVLVNREEDGIPLDFDESVMFVSEIQTEIIRLVNDPKVKMLSDGEVDRMIHNYDTKSGATMGKKKDTIRSLLYATKAYWDEQGIEPGSTEDVVKELKRMHTDWGITMGDECRVFPVWD